MNGKIIFIGGLMAACFTASQALAVEPSFPHNPKIFAKLDADSSGRITLQEIQPKAEKRLLRLDGDKNGEVSAAEVDTYLQELQDKRRAQLLAHLDSDKNGVITVAELDNLLAAMFNGADTDKDGGVSIEEARDFKVGQWRKQRAETKAN